MPEQHVAFTLDPLVPVASLPAMIRPETTALVLVDLQVDFISPEGRMGQFGMDFTPINAALENIKRLATAARKAGVLLVWPRVITSPETDMAALKTLAQRKGRGEGSIATCRRDSKGADYYGLRPEPGDVEIEKTLFSSFHGTELDDRLKARGIETLIMTGFTTDCCVDCTAREAFHRNYNVFIATDSCAAYTPALHLGALNGLAKNVALLTDTQSVMAGWQPV
ncbi:MAG: isochorismatase family protein [Rhizobiales bacterium]|nr:isochorismatase family protein [Hyphomicrobiales bacterium]